MPLWTPADLGSALKASFVAPSNGATGSGFVTGDAEWTVVGVYSPTGNSDQLIQLDGSSASQIGHASSWFTIDAQILSAGTGSGDPPLDGRKTMVSGDRKITAFFDLILSVNGVETTAHGSSRNYNGGLTIGVSVQRAYACSSLVTADRQKLEGYCAWQEGVTLDAAHPYFAAPPTTPGGGGLAVPSMRPFLHNLAR